MAGTHAVMENKYNHVTPGKVVRIIVLIALLLFLAAPLLWQISLAFKGPKDDMYAAPYLIPVDPTIQNFVDVFNRLPLLFYVCNTLIVAALNIGGNIISGCFAGYSIANVWQRFWRVCVPQVKGTMALVGIFSFMGSWNDFLWPLIVLTDDSHYTLTLGMSRLQGTFVSDPRVVAAGTIIALVPIMIFFLVFQRYIFNGLEAGSVKE